MDFRWLINVCAGELISGVQNYIENKVMKQTSSSIMILETRNLPVRNTNEGIYPWGLIAGISTPIGEL